jgi:hypothetical protein
MRHKFLSLIAATCMVGLMAVSSQALEPVSNTTLSSISAKGVDVNNYSYVSLSGSQNWASGIVIADLSSSAVNNQANYASYARYLLQVNSGKAINKVEASGSTTQNSSVSLNNSEAYASGLMIVNASSSAANNQLNVSWNSGLASQLNFGKAINIISGEGKSCGSGCQKSNVNTASGVVLTNGSENNTSGLMIANMSSSAANTQLNVSYGAPCGLPQINTGTAVNVIRGGF